MSEIVLVQPYTRTLDEMSILYPEGLLAVAAVPHEKGYDVSLIDQRVVSDFDTSLYAAVGPETLIFGVTAITGQQIKYALNVTTRPLKERYPTSRSVGAASMRRYCPNKRLPTH